jgi:hypothetical protein
MIQVKKPPMPDPEFVAVVTAGAARASSHVADFLARKEFAIDDTLYKRYMRFLLSVFHDKCAYCEVLIASNQPGDVEHFRPKGRVVDESFKPVKVDIPGMGEVEHPGYFWLAYSWDNLFPSCIDCNRYRRHGTVDEPIGAGKADRFPVANFRARAPGEEAQEEALLIDPSACDPSLHLDFNTEGEIKAKTDVGARTLAILGLNCREKLLKARQRALRDARNEVESYITAVNTGNTAREEEARLRINAMWAGEEPHTVMQQIALREMQERFRRRWGIAPPLPIPPPI